ncbi:MAG: LamG domain-containing protein, partial [Arcicella sp.]|nr:LamG domain-containing protein [Arcicella sp.]
ATQTVSPVTSTTYTLSSVKDNTCGIGTASGSATITVNNSIQLLACYPFNGNAQDSKGTYHGTVYGATLTTDRFGNANSAYSFNGNNFIELANPNDFRNNTFTYSAWVNPSVLPTSGDFKSIIGISSGQVLGINYMNEPSWAMTAYNNSSASYDIHPSSNIGVSTNAWRHITVVRNSTQLKIYVDGTLVRTSSTSIPTTPTYTNSNPVVVYKAMIGTRPDATNIQFFNGKIDDVKIYRGALNDTQVQALFLAEQQCPTVETGGLIALMNVSSSTTCPSGNITVSAVTNSLQVDAGNPLIVELSNASGSFTNPIQIGTGITNNITCIIPSNTVAGNYKIRVVSGTNPNQVISVNALSITVNPAVTATISGTTTIFRGNSATLTLNFTGVGPWTYSLSGINLTATANSSIVNVSVSPTTTTTYTIQSVNNACGAGTTSGSAIVTVNTIPQLIACYKFDDNALDSKGNHHGTVNGATLTSDRFGRANSAYNFDGLSNIQLNNAADFGVATFTWSAWVNASVLATLNIPKTVFSVGYDAGDQHINLYYLNTSGQAGWNYGSYTGYTTVAMPIMISYTAVATNNWVHLAVVRTPTERKFYINGQLSLSGTAAPPFYNTPILAAIGSRYNGTQPFSGKIDDVKIYNGALTDEDVLLLYNEEQGECSEPCSGMIYSLGSGNWNTPATWSCGRVPDLTDKVLIKAGHTITISTNDAKAKKLLNNGQVSFTNATSKLIFN